MSHWYPSLLRDRFHGATVADAPARV